MPDVLLVKWILVSVFLVGGIALVLLGWLIWRKLWGNHSVQVQAMCVGVNVSTVRTGVGLQHTHYQGAKRPVYEYEYQGIKYTGSPLMVSNRKGYRPEPGPCTIRINPKHPERVYSSERKFAALVLIFVGSGWVVAAALMAWLIRV